MLFPRTEHWCCQLQRQHIQLYREEKLQGQYLWQPGLPLSEQLDRVLSPLRSRLPWKNSITFELDVPYVQYLLTPWPQGIATPAELRQYTRMLMSEHSHPRVDDAKISFINSEYGANAFAATLDNTLFIELKTTAGRHHLRFRGCSTPFNRMLKVFGRHLPEDALFACLSESESCFAARYQGHWHSIFSLNLPSCDSIRQMDIANRLAGLPPLQRYVMHTQQASFAPIALSPELAPTGTE